MSDSKYSVLFMRDDRDVSRYRVSPFWLKMFIFAQVFLLLCAVGGIYMGVRGLKVNAGLREVNRDMEQRLVDAEVRLERLSNMEKILQSYDPAELQSLLAAATSEVEKKDEQAPVDLNKIFTRVDTQQVGVENLQAKEAGRKVNVSFELNNLQSSNKVISGLADFSFVTKDGKTVVAKTNKRDLAFQIQRFKRIQTAFNLPDGMGKKDIFGLRLEIKGSDGGIIFAETYPLYHILA
ncbi:hypothetical protein [Pseudodesulfovibrio sp.]|uniref:hypothetical protein n=1 Tax=unclassified Pseudodesulfovibrio TaxID=2661612 RepID=UPI003B00BBEB